MDNNDYTVCDTQRKKGKHLTSEDRREIKTLHKEGYSYRKIAERLNCSPSTILYEIRKGTPIKDSKIGRPAGYSDKLGQEVYENNRKRCGRNPKLTLDSQFLMWVIEKVKNDKWSLDACVGYAKANGLFQEDIVCTKTLYNYLHAGILGIYLHECPEILKRKQKRKYSRENKRVYGNSIDTRPQEASNGVEYGHWEIDTVVGKRNGKEPVVLTIVEKVSRYYLAIRIAGKEAQYVNEAMRQLQKAYKDKFSQIFKTITADNGSEFAKLSEIEDTGAKIYFAHPYSSWERAQNERHNRIFRTYLPKGKSIEKYSAEKIASFAEDMNSTPRRCLGYKTSGEIFREFEAKIMI